MMDKEIKTLEEVIKEEKLFIAKRKGKEEAEDFTGICISGGGIRSATLALGFVQSLVSKGKFKMFDYMSTVSGGGYFGSCITSIFANDYEIFDTNKKDGVGLDYESKSPFNNLGIKFNEEGENADVFDDSKVNVKNQMYHLRMHGDYLTPDKSIFSRDVKRMIGAFLGGSFFNFTSFVVLVFIFFSVYYLVINLALGQNFKNNIELNDVFKVFFSDLKPKGIILKLATGFAIGVTYFLISISYWGEGIRSKVKNYRKKIISNKNINKESLKDKKFITYSFIILLVICHHILALIFSFFERGNNWQIFSTPFFISIGLLFGVYITYLFKISSINELFFTEKDIIRGRSIKDGILGNAWYIFIISIILPIVIIFIFKFKIKSETVLISPLLSLLSGGIAYQIINKLLLSESNKESFLKRHSDKILSIFFIIFIASFILSIGRLITFLDSSFGNSLLLPVLTLVSLLFLVFIGYYIDSNIISMHYFYRDRLAEAYLTTSSMYKTKDSKHLKKVIRDNRELKLKDIYNSNLSYKAPYHLIVTALNLNSSDSIVKKSLKSDHFIFSQKYIGSKSTGYVETNDKIFLSQAMAISGAAVGSGMGQYGSLIKSFFITLFNLRTGIWFDNPKYGGKKSPWYSNNSYYLLFFKEMWANFSEKSYKINISDGGHTGDNLGLLPLLRRKCKKIVVCDFEEDSDYTFASLNHASRIANIEENIKIEIDLTELTPAEKEGGKFPMSKASVAKGKIIYFDGTEGELIYVKSSLSYEGSKTELPLNIFTYKIKHSDFPHESTADQYFNDDQFEAYRCLGEHLGNLCKC